MTPEPEPSPRQVASHILPNSQIAGGNAGVKHAIMQAEPGLFKRASKWLRGKFGAKTESSLKEVLEDVLDEESHESLQISEEEKTLLKNIAEFGEITVDDIMVDRKSVV